MKRKVVACFLFIVVIAISQQVRGYGYNHKFLSKQNSKLRLRSVKEKLIQSFFHEVTSQAKEEGQNPNCPDLSNTKKVYRVIRSDENCQTGLIAKNPSANSPVLNHVQHGSQDVGTQFISTTTSLDVANTKVQPGEEVVEIDVSSLSDNCKILDLNDANTREKELGTNELAFNLARNDCEALLDCGNNPVPCTVIEKPTETNEKEPPINGGGNVSKDIKKDKKKKICLKRRNNLKL